MACAGACGVIKKYGATTKPKEPKEQAKRMRFLQSRGFTGQAVWKAFC
ncbi:RecX family transcriptional regulator [Thiomicrorhabdus aquaedulcis]|nr:RecX family transcriptional regulator [Thiomicrorhabdus aquaedulcis]